MPNPVMHIETTITELEQIVTAVEMKLLHCMTRLDGYQFECGQPAVLINLETEQPQCADCFNEVDPMRRGIYGTSDAYDRWKEN